MGFTLRTRIDWLVYLSGLQFIFAPTFVKPILTLWYVGAILVYYAIFLVLWRVASNNTVLVLLGTTLFAPALLTHHTTGLLDQRFFKYYFVFLSGMILARLGDSFPLLSGKWLAVKGGVVVVGVWMVSIVIQLDVPPTSIAYIVVCSFFIISSAVFLFSLVATAGVVTPWRWVAVAAHASYFVYLFHRPLWASLEGIIPIPVWEYQLLFRILPASAIVVITCYYLQSAYDSLIRGLGGKFNR
jgi:peptidoglycan/LPS O-acetylase OafA/YrhL